MGSALALLFWPSRYPPYDEGTAYVNIAKLDFHGIPGYYAGRVVHPLVVRIVAATLHIPIDARAFIWVSAAALIVFFGCLGAYRGLESYRSPGLWLVLAVTPAVVDPYRNYYWHDLFYAALCALFFLALRTSWWLGLAFIPLLYLTRESTIVLVVVLVALSAVRGRWKLCLSALALGLAGLFAEANLVRHASPGRHGIPMALLDALKLPYNFLLNFCGLEFWINTNADTSDPPKWVRNLPGWLHLGNIHQVGFSGFFWERPAWTLLVLSTAFGILPLVIARAGTRARARSLLERPDLAVACSFGALMYILTPLQGTSPWRYSLYGWPMFWLFGVALIEAAFANQRTRVKIVLLSASAAWVPAAVRLATGPLPRGAEGLSDVSDAGLLISLALVALIYLAAWRVAKPDEGEGS